MAFSNKTDLEKKNVKILRSYSRYFNIKQPYKIIIGPYFCQIVAEKRISLSDGIKSVFIQRDCELYTTRCCINDLQKLIHQKQTKFIRGAHILRTLKLLPCLHNNVNKSTNIQTNKKKTGWNCISSIQCIKMYMNNGKYCFAMQPRSFLGRVRAKAGIPCIWMYESTMILDKLSQASHDFIKQNRKNFILDTNDDEDIDLRYDVMGELQLDDEQNNEKDKLKKVKSKQDNGNAIAMKRMKGKGYVFNGYGENRIRYGPDGGFDTMGMRMRAPSRKKRRTKRGKKSLKNEGKDEFVNLNDNSFEDRNENEDVMTISKSQKSMSNWWKK